MGYLNLGCGSRYLKDWTNIDFVSSSKHVASHNLLEGIPHPDNQFKVVYHSHVLEHFEKNDATAFIKECHRVLAPGGILRVVVPDLEQIAKQYLAYLERALEQPSDLNHSNYEWSVIEMYDQTVRNFPGGEMGKLWSRPELLNENVIANRMGQEFLKFRENRAFPSASTKKPLRPKKPKSKRNRPKSWKEKLASCLLGEPRLREYLELGKFRKGGEIHQWMYDRYSLSKLLEQAGFHGVEQKTADSSEIEQWDEFNSLDIENGNIRKPDSLFIEGIK